MPRPPQVHVDLSKPAGREVQMPLFVKGRPAFARRQSTRRAENAGPPAVTVRFLIRSAAVNQPELLRDRAVPDHRARSSDRMTIMGSKTPMDSFILQEFHSKAR